MAIDLTGQIERLEAFEERLGVTLEALSAFVEHHQYDAGASLKVCGELHARNGPNLEQSIILQIAAYDRSGRVVGTSNYTQFEAGRFFGLEVFDAEIELPMAEISRVRIYPARSEY